MLGRYRRALGFASLPLVGAVVGIGLGLLSDQPMVLGVVFLAAAVTSILAALDAARLSPSELAPGWGRIILLWLGLLFAVEIAKLPIRRYVAEAFRIPSGAMLPTLQVGDALLVSKWARVPKHGEVIVFRYPKDPDKNYIKRVIGVGGDTVQVCGGAVLVNDRPLQRVLQPGPCEYQDFDEESGDTIARSVRCTAYREWNGRESYITVHNEGSGERNPTCGPPTTVAPGHVFVMGDNRDNSHDSRFWGTVAPELVQGKAWAIQWSKSPVAIRWNRIHLRVHQPTPPPPATLER